jgi:6-phosphogluconolactonase
MVSAMNLTEFDSRDAASSAAADFLGSALKRSLAEQGRAVLMTCGGTSPGGSLVELSHHDLDWKRVTVTLTDERLVPVSDDASNEKMVREKLFQNSAASASFCELSEPNVSRIVAGPLVSLVGMGEDGHFASIFPGSLKLNQLLDLSAVPDIFDVSTSTSPYPRRTANLAMILKSTTILLMAFGDKKKQVLKAAEGLPIAMLLAQKQVPLSIYWAK